MRSRRAAWILGVVGLVGLGHARAAAAAPLAFVGEFAIQISALEAIAIQGAGFASVDGRAEDPDHLAALRLEASQFAVTGLVVPVTDPAARPIYGVVATVHNAAGGFAVHDGSLSGVLAIPGVTKVCLFGDCHASPLANLTVPMSVVGAGGSVAASAAVNVTVVGAPWTTGTVSVGSMTGMGFAQGPNGVASSTLQPSGSVQLVTPIFIATNLGGLASVSAIGFLKLHLVPEPTTLVLLGGGLVGLVASGCRRRAQQFDSKA